MTVAAESKVPQVGQATAIVLKSVSGGKTLSLVDLNGFGLRFKVKYINSDKTCLINQQLYKRNIWIGIS